MIWDCRWIFRDTEVHWPEKTREYLWGAAHKCLWETACFAFFFFFLFATARGCCSPALFYRRMNKVKSLFWINLQEELLRCISSYLPRWGAEAKLTVARYSRSSVRLRQGHQPPKKNNTANQNLFLQHAFGISKNGKSGKKVFRCCFSEHKWNKEELPYPKMATTITNTWTCPQEYQEQHQSGC